MKTKFLITGEIFNGKESIDKMLEKYEKYYKPDGWLINLDDDGEEAVYMIFPNEYNLQIGDMVSLNGYRTVVYKCHCILEDFIEYVLQDESD